MNFNVFDNTNYISIIRRTGGAAMIRKQDVMSQPDLLLLMILALSIPVLCGAGEISYPTFSYNDQELAKVREWEKTWVGKKVTTETIDQVKDFLSEPVYKAMKDPKVVGIDSLWFEVVPYRPYTVSKG